MSRGPKINSWRPADGRRGAVLHVIASIQILDCRIDFLSLTGPSAEFIEPQKSAPCPLTGNV